MTRIRYTVRLDCTTCKEKVFEAIWEDDGSLYDRVVQRAVELQNNLPPEHAGHYAAMSTETKVIPTLQP